MPDKDNFNAIIQKEVTDFVNAYNTECIDHQQDILHTEDGQMDCLYPGTHASGSHLTKTVQTKDTRYVVRRLTPLECCRLQGFPDDWCDGVPGSDSAQYKMWGNGMALPNALHVVKGIRNLVLDEMLS